MKAIRTITLAALAATTLAACTGPQERRGLETSRQPVVTRTAYALDVNLAGGGEIEASEQRRLTEWLDALKLGYGDRIALDFGAGYGTAMARKSIEGIAARYGMLLSETAPVTAGDVVPGTARIVVIRSTAAVPGCPDWSQQSETSITGGTHSNFGCGTNSTIAAMIANPEDLVSGSEDAERDSETVSKPVRALRAKQPSGGQ